MLLQKNFIIFFPLHLPLLHYMISLISLFFLLLQYSIASICISHIFKMPTAPIPSMIGPTVYAVHILYTEHGMLGEQQCWIKKKYIVLHHCHLKTFRCLSRLSVVANDLNKKRRKKKNLSTVVSFRPWIDYTEYGTKHSSCSPAIKVRTTTMIRDLTNTLEDYAFEKFSIKNEFQSSTAISKHEEKKRQKKNHFENFRWILTELPSIWMLFIQLIWIINSDIRREIKRENVIDVKRKIHLCYERTKRKKKATMMIMMMELKEYLNWIYEHKYYTIVSISIGKQVRRKKKYRKEKEDKN